MPKAPSKKDSTTIKYGGAIGIMRRSTGGEARPAPDFIEKAMMLREQCNAEREATAEARKTTTSGAVNAMQNGSWEPLWQPLTVIIDSGAAETVIPHTCVMDHQIHETEASRSGICYTSATGEPIPNLGEQKIPIWTQEGTVRILTCQAAPVSRPLGSVKRMCQAGHRVVFDEEGSYIENKNTGEINWLREEDGNYVLDTYVVPSHMWSPPTTGFPGPR